MGTFWCKARFAADTESMPRLARSASGYCSKFEGRYCLQSEVNVRIENAPLKSVENDRRAQNNVKIADRIAR